MENLIGESSDEGSDSGYLTGSTDIVVSSDSFQAESEASQELEEFTNAPFIQACANGDLIAVKAYLDAGGLPDVRGSYNQEVALIEAARYGHVDIVDRLLEQNANIEIKNIYNQTALMWAVKEGHNDIAERLLDNGANPTIKNDNGETALLWAAEAANIAGIKLLVAKGVNIVKDGKIFIADMMGDNFCSSATSQLRDYFKSHMTELGSIADMMVIRTRDAITMDEHTISKASKYSRADILSVLANKFGATDNQASIIYDQAMNDARSAVEELPRASKRVRR